MARTHKLIFSTGRVIKRNRLVTSKAFKEVGKNMEQVLKKTTGKQGPPRSKQGRPPKMDTGTLNRSIRVKATGRRIEVSMAIHGMFLDNKGRGFRHYQSGKQVIRPWYTPKMFEADARRTWERKLNTAMRKFSK
jgi:hypothetical protein